ncbi:hypothetical protein [Bacillus sp. BML-BC060]|uniref:hypothetical protein n=1 Tax=Bacillus sp. BML-BC060 TaxID=2842487 RepID=UPI001C80D144|nr:hypothetical protein [Bacillus sp. BML-BC060]
MQLDKDKFLGYEHLYWETEEIIQSLYEVAVDFADTMIEKFDELHDEEIGCKCGYATILYFPWDHSILIPDSDGEYYEWHMCMKICKQCESWIIELEN